MAAALVLSVPSSGWTQTTPLDQNQPRTFDYEERSGFPLASEERLLSFADTDTLLRSALQVAPAAAMRDWEDVLERLEYDAPPGREHVRVVRVYSDQPVFVKEGVALLPDPSRPEDEVSPDDFVPERDCEPSPQNLKAARCVALHRDHVQNRDSIAVLLSARTVIFKGINRTGGQSLITLTENLWMQSRDDRVDLSARSDRAPGIGQGDLYRIYDGTLPGLGESEDNPLTQLVGIDTLIGGEAPPWSFPTAPDLAWQYDIARRAVSDYDWTERDPCVGAQDPRACFLAREPRGLAGLPGGNWFGVSRRATALQAESFGQPGGHGGPGVAPPKGITCAPPPVRGPRCGFLGPACDALNDPPENPFCSVDQLASEDPPNDNDLCACDDRCEQTACNVNYAEDDPTGNCTVTCGVDPLANGFPGGQGGPGGQRGIVRIQVVTRESRCSGSINEVTLSDPSRAHELDERCTNGIADDGDESVVDCDSAFCSLNPDVLVCAAPDLTDPIHTLDGARIRDVFNGLVSLTPAPIPDPTPGFTDIFAFNPIFDPLPTQDLTGPAILSLGDGRWVSLNASADAMSIPQLGTVAEAPVWGVKTPFTIARSLLEQSITFEDADGVLTLPSVEAAELLARLAGESVVPAGSGTADLGGTFGFESLDAWTSTTPGLALSPEHTEGAASLSVPAAGWVELVTPPLTGPLGSVGANIAFDLSLPSPAANPWWAGDVSVVLDAPSVGLYSAFVGQKSLTGLPLGSFQRIEIALSEDARSRLARPELSDLRVRLLLNMAPGSGRYLFDALSLGQTESGEAVPPTVLAFSVTLPLDTELEQTAIGANESLTIHDRARVVSGSSFAGVVNAGDSSTQLGVEVQLGDVSSIASITVGDRAVSHGVVRSAGGITRGADVFGQMLPQATLAPVSAMEWTVEMPPASHGVYVAPDDAEALSPGSFGDVHVHSRSTLLLPAGTYAFDSLTVEPQGVLSLETLDGPVIIYVRDELVFRGELLDSGEAESLLVAVAGTDEVVVEAPFHGTLVAPNAAVRLATGATEHSGSVFARSVELDPDVRFELRPFGYWPLLTGVGTASNRVSQLLQFVREAITAENRQLTDDDALNPRFVLEVARMSASESLRSVLRDLLAREAGELLDGVFVRSGDALGGAARFPSLWVRAGDTWTTIDDHHQVDPSRVRDALCGDTVTGGDFRSGDGRPGSPGTGSPGAEHRCNGFNTTVDAVCVRPPSVEEGDCRRGEGVGRQCPDLTCQHRLEYPNDEGECPADHTLVPLVVDVPNPIPGAPAVEIRVGDPCPAVVQGAGGVECKGKHGATGIPAKPRISAPRSLVRNIGLDSWAVALDRVHPLELSRRGGRANTLYKRGEGISALARYLATTRLVKANVDADDGALCLPGDNCDVPCASDPLLETTERRQRLCSLELDLSSRTTQLNRGENYYGYLPDFVPPTSVRTHDPLEAFDLASGVMNEIESAERQALFWQEYAQRLSQGSRDTAEAEAASAIELRALSESASAGGALTLELSLADQRIDDIVSEILQIRQALQQLEDKKTTLATSAGPFEIDVMELGGMALGAAATAYGGPLAGAAAASVWRTAFQAGASAEAKETFGDLESLSAEVKNGCGQVVDTKNAKPDYSECSKVVRDEILKGIQSEVGQPFLDWAKNTFLAATDLGEPAASKMIGTTFLDGSIAELMVALHTAGLELGQNLVARRIAQEKFFAAQRQIARLELGRIALGRVTLGGPFPPPEVQFQVADLALSSAAHSVERAGEMFFLLRRGVERDVVPLDPLTGEDLLERSETVSAPLECRSLPDGASPASLDINFRSLPCFRERVDFLMQMYALTQDRSLMILEESDTQVPFEQWSLSTDENGDAAYLFDMPITFEGAQRDFRDGHLRQKIENVLFFLETDDPTPALVHMTVSRPTTSPDVYYVGMGPGPNGDVIPKFQVFDIARGSGAAPGSPLYELLRDRTQYEHDVFACNGLGPTTVGAPEIIEACRLSSLNQADRSFLEGRSLIGTYRFKVRAQALAGRTPTRMFTQVFYTYDSP